MLASRQTSSKPPGSDIFFSEWLLDATRHLKIFLGLHCCWINIIFDKSSKGWCSSDCQLLCDGVQWSAMFNDNEWIKWESVKFTQTPCVINQNALTRYLKDPFKSKKASVRTSWYAFLYFEKGPSTIRRLPFNLSDLYITAKYTKHLRYYSSISVIDRKEDVMLENVHV